MRNGIIGAGNWIIDHVKSIDRWPNEGELCNIVAETYAGGGGPCNILFDLAALKCNIPLYAAGLLGNDKGSSWILNEITKLNIDARFMKLTKDDTPTGFTDVMSGNGRRTFFYCAGTNDLLDIEDLVDIDVPAKIFYLGYLLLLGRLDSSDTEYGTVAARLLANMRAKGYRTAVDMVSEVGEKFNRIIPMAMPHIDILVINEIEAGHSLGEQIRQADNSMRYELLPKAVEHFFDFGVKDIVTIHFPEGAYAATRDGQSCFQPSCQVASSEIVGTNGAGDAFFAGLLYALHEELELADALRMASASARFNLKATTASAGAPSLAVLMEYLKSCNYGEIPKYFQK